MASIVEIEFKTKGESEFLSSAKRMKAAADDIGKGTSGFSRQAKQDVDQLASGFSNLQKGILTTAAAISTFRGVTSAFSFVVREMGQLAEQGARIEGVSQSFRDLQNSIGNLSGVSLQKLRNATHGLISDLDLMQKANQAVLLGLPKKGFEDLAGAAVKLGRAMGIDAVAGMEALVIGVGRGSRLVLDNIGVIVKASASYDAYSKQMGIVGRELTDLEKQLAFQREAMVQIKDSSGKLKVVFNDAASASLTLSTAIENMWNNFVQGINKSETLAQAIQNLQKAMEAVDKAGGSRTLSERFGKFLGDVGGSFVNPARNPFGFAGGVGDAIAGFFQGKPDTTEREKAGIKARELLDIKKAESVINDELNLSLRSQNANLSNNLDLLTISKERQEDIRGIIKEQISGSITKAQYAEKIKNLALQEGEAARKAAMENERLSAGRAAKLPRGVNDKEFQASLIATQAAAVENVYRNAGILLRESTTEAKKFNGEAEKSARAAERIATRVSRAFSQEPGSEFLQEGGGIVSRYLFGELSGEQAAAQMTEVLSRIKGGTGDIITALGNYQAEGKKTFDEINARLEEQAEHVEDLVKKYEELSGKTLARPLTFEQQQNLERQTTNLQWGKDTLPSSIQTLFKNDIENLTDEQRKAFGEFSDSIDKFSIIGDAINQAGQALGALARGISSGAFGKIKNAGAAGAAIGQTGGAIAGGILGAGMDTAVPGLGTAIGIAIGSQVGGQSGGMVGEIVSAIHREFGGNTPGTTARKAVDKWFAELFDSERLAAVVNGQVTRIKDFVFQGQTAFGGAISGFARDDNGFDALKNLDSTTQQSFNGVGRSVEQLLGVAEDAAGQVAAMLANNIGGSLENLQLLVQETGYSFEQMGEALLASFYDGQLTIQELQSGFQGLADVFTAGIPGAIGAIDDAYQNLQAALADGKGSRLLLDSLRDIGAEAQELGINTLPNLASAMVNQFGIAADKVAMIMEAMKVAGIGSVKDLLDASTSTIAAVAANLDSLLKGGAAGAVGIADPTQQEGRTPPGLFSPARYAEGKKEKAGKNELLEQVNAIKGILSASESYQKVVSDLASGLISKKEALRASNIEYKAAARLVGEQTKLEKELEAETKKGKKASQERMQTLLLGLEQINKKISEFGKGIKLGDGELIGQLDELARKMKDFFDIGAAAASAGVGLDDLTNSVTELFKRGSIGADEALQKYLKYKEALEGGILDKKGAVGDAIGKLLSTGADAGTLSIQAFRGILTEGKEAGLGTLGDFYEKFKEKLGVPAAEALRNALNAENVFNFEDFSKVSDDAIVRLLGRMKEMKFPFEETSKETKKLLDQITQIGKLGPQYVDVILNVRANYDSRETRRLAQQANVNLRGEGVPQR